MSNQGRVGEEARFTLCGVGLRVKGLGFKVECLGAGGSVLFV